MLQKLQDQLKVGKRRFKVGAQARALKILREKRKMSIRYKLKTPTDPQDAPKSLKYNLSK